MEVHSQQLPESPSQQPPHSWSSLLMLFLLFWRTYYKKKKKKNENKKKVVLWLDFVICLWYVCSLLCTLLSLSLSVLIYVCQCLQSFFGYHWGHLPPEPPHSTILPLSHFWRSSQPLSLGPAIILGGRRGTIRLPTPAPPHSTILPLDHFWRSSQPLSLGPAIILGGRGTARSPAPEPPHSTILPLGHFRRSSQPLSLGPAIILGGRGTARSPTYTSTRTQHHPPSGSKVRWRLLTTVPQPVTHWRVKPS